MSRAIDEVGFDENTSIFFDGILKSANYLDRFLGRRDRILSLDD